MSNSETEGELVFSSFYEDGRDYLLTKEPIIVRWFRWLENDENMATIEFDFGMSYDISLDKNFFKIFLKETSPLEIIKKTIIFDVMHSFFHCNQDPNYTHLHWAIYGNLKDRVYVCEPTL